MEIKLVHDFWYRRPIPNGINYRYLEEYLNRTLKDLSSTDLKYGKKSETVWNGFGNLPDFRSVPISDIKITDVDKIYLFRICICGGGHDSFGGPYSLTEGYTFLEFISKKAINYIKNFPNFYLFIDFTNEGVTESVFLDNLYKDLVRLGIPFNKVVFITGDYNIDTVLKEWLVQNDRKSDKIHTIYSTWSYPSKQFDYISSNNFVKLNTINLNKDIKRLHKFLIFNRRIRNHRFYSILYFYYHDLIKDMLISYDLSIDSNIEYDYNTIKHLFDVNENSLSTIYEDLVTTKQKLTIDIDDITKAFGIGCEDSIDPFLNSYIHITSETSVFHRSGYLSEKTWKPIANLQPFIMMGSHRSLEVLKDMGFKTFHPFIDESYDLVESNEDRYVMVLQEIKRLSTLSIDEIHSWYYSIQDILKHNQDVFFSKKTLGNYKNKVIRDIFDIHDPDMVLPEISKKRII